MEITLNQYKKQCPDYFKSSCLDLFLEKFLVQKGSNYFVWLKEDRIQKDFESFIERQLISNEKYLFCKEQVFKRRRVPVICTVRDVKEDLSFKFDDKGNLVYSYNGITYNGIGTIQHNLTQKIVVDIDKLQIVSFHDTLSRRSDSSTKFLRLNTDFLDKYL